MVEHAVEVGAESVEFTVLDAKPGYTDCLLLNAEQRLELLARCRQIAARAERGELAVELFRFDQFLRRISTPAGTTGLYDEDVINTLPCTVGWTFARVMPDGNVNPCLKAHRYPLGSIYESSFREIWSSPRQYEFRLCANKRRKEGEIFSLIGNDPSTSVGCFRGCDDLGRNEETYARLRALTAAERARLRLAGSYLRRRGMYL
jgi:MoaA/NifB/PqqE/SkfB family radical SAM enzyme